MLSLLRPKTKTNPVFYEDELRLVLAEEPERLERARTQRDNVDLLTWNVFASLETHRDRDYLAHVLTPLGGSGLRAPVRISLWTGRRRQPLVRPSPAYLQHIRARARAVGGDDAGLTDFEQPIEVPVRIETPDVLVLVDTTLSRVPRGNGGRDRVVELVDSGVDQARRLSKTLAVAFVHRSGSPAAAELSAHVDALRDPARLAAAMPYRKALPPVVLRELPWQHLLTAWSQETAYLRLGGQPTRAFQRHVDALGLR
jgi:hypothetical protein